MTSPCMPTGRGARTTETPSAIEGYTTRRTTIKSSGELATKIVVLKVGVALCRLNKALQS